VLAASAALLTPLGETPLQITLQESAEVFEHPLSRRFEDFRAIVLRERKKLEGLWKRHADVVGKLGLVQKAVANAVISDGKVRGGAEDANEASYFTESQRIKQEYQTEREKLLADFEAEAEKVRDSVIKCEEVSTSMAHARRLIVIESVLTSATGMGKEASRPEGQGSKI